MWFSVGFGTHKGNVRQTNQDSVGVFHARAGLFGIVEQPLMVVADGMGGHLGGEVASRVAVETVKEVFARRVGTLRPQDLMTRIVEEANDAILSASLDNEDLDGMGTTIVAALADRNKIVVANVGDSRAYHIRNGTMTQITQDHSLLAEQLRSSMVLKQQQSIVAGRNVLTRSVGRHPDVEVDVFKQPWRRGDRILLCSDGLWGFVPEREILTVVQNNAAPKAARILIELAMSFKSRDNISVVVAQYN